MAHHTVDFRDDVPKIQAYIAKRVSGYRHSEETIGAVAVGFKLCQSSCIGVNFDTRPTYQRDVSRALGRPVLNMPHWARAFWQFSEYGISFVRVDGTRKSMRPFMDDSVVAAEFGKTILLVLRDCIARQVFKPLPLRPDCRLEVLEFDWMWEWPSNLGARGQENMLRRLRGTRLQVG